MRLVVRPLAFCVAVGLLMAPCASMEVGRGPAAVPASRQVTEVYGAGAHGWKTMIPLFLNVLDTRSRRNDPGGLFTPRLER